MMAKKLRVYTPEFRRQMVELTRAGRSPEELSRELETTAQSIRNWAAQRSLLSAFSLNEPMHRGLSRMTELQNNSASERYVIVFSHSLGGERTLLLFQVGGRMRPKRPFQPASPSLA